MTSVDFDRLAKLSSECVWDELEQLDSELLIRALDHKSTKIGDSAAGILARRMDQPLVIEAICGHKLRTTKGKIRGTNILHRRGLSCAGARRAYESDLDDRSGHVVSNALFGLVFSRSKESIPLIRQKLAKPGISSLARSQLERALESLLADDPTIYSPYFEDAAGVWCKKGDRSI